jgi:hypothetical protein
LIRGVVVLVKVLEYPANFDLNLVLRTGTACWISDDSEVGGDVGRLGDGGVQSRDDNERPRGIQGIALSGALGVEGPAFEQEVSAA